MGNSTLDALDKYCDDYASFFQLHGWDIVLAFLLVALFLATVTALAKLAVELRQAFARDGTRTNLTDADQASPILQALKGVIEALTNAPAWFAIFLAALAIIWVGSATMESTCTPEAPTRNKVG